MHPLDYIVISATVVALVGSAVFFTRRGSRSSFDFVLGGRKLPWWLAGMAMVAGSTNADSALHQSGKVQRDGLAGAWFYWSQIVSAIFHSVVFSRLWRRTELTTIVEFFEFRYSGRAGRITRMWGMAYTSLIEGAIMLAYGFIALIKIFEVLFGKLPAVDFGLFFVPPELLVIAAGIAVAMVYSALAGLLGVVAGDVFEFLIAIVCAYVLMLLVYREVGWADGLRGRLVAVGQEAKLSLAPQWGLAMFVFLVVQPLASLAGSSPVNQRFLAMKDERAAIFSGVWRVTAHYFFRTWPWYLCGLCALVLVPGALQSRENSYLVLIRDFLPTGVKGLMLAGFLVAFMSAVGNTMHGSGAIFVNDFYRPFVRPGASDRHYVNAIRVAMISIAVAASFIALQAGSILGLLQFLITMSAGCGLFATLRWFWWRINGWSELAVQIVALPVTLLIENSAGIFGEARDPVASLSRALGGTTADDRFAASFIITVALTTGVGLLVMFVTPPEPMDRLENFYRKVRPYGWWGPVRARCREVVVTDRFGRDFGVFALCVTLCGGLLFGVGFLLLGQWRPGLVFLALGTAAGVAAVRLVHRMTQSPS